MIYDEYVPQLKENVEFYFNIVNTIILFIQINKFVQKIQSNTK
jgi:hypothetical protein